MPLPNELTLSELFDILSHPRRRFVLGYLDETDGAVQTDSLAERIAVWEGADAPGDSSVAAVEDIKLSLHHVHLPKLEESGFLTHDSTHVRLDAEDVTLTELSVDERLQEERDKILAGC